MIMKEIDRLNEETSTIRNADKKIMKVTRPTTIFI